LIGPVAVFDVEGEPVVERLAPHRGAVPRDEGDHSFGGDAGVDGGVEEKNSSNPKVGHSLPKMGISRGPRVQTFGMFPWRQFHTQASDRRVMGRGEHDPNWQARTVR